MPRKRVRITTQPEMRKQKRGGYSVRFRIPQHDGQPESKSPWRKFPDAKTKGLALIEAEAYRQELEDQINDYALWDGITFGEYARRWHDDRKDTGELNGLSFDREELRIKKIEKSKLGAIPLEDITEEDIDEFKKENIDKGFSVYEQERLFKKAQQVFKYAVSRRRIKYDPTVAVQSVKAKPKKARRSLSAEEQNRLMEALASEGFDGRRAAILLALTTGMRRGEILGLKWKDIDPAARCLKIERQVNASGEVVPPKNNSVGVIPLDEFTMVWLRTWRQELRRKKFLGGRLRDDPHQTLEETPVCCNEKCGFYLPSNFDRWRRRYFEEHGLGTFREVYTTKDAKGNVRKHYIGFEGYNLHELRHTMATELVGVGTDIQTVRGIMRHKKITTTEQYLHDIDENKTEAVDKVSQKRLAYNPEEEKKKRNRAYKGDVFADGYMTRWD